MGLSRRAKAAESPATTASTSSRLLAFFSHKKQDGQVEEDKRPHLRIRAKKSKNRTKRSRSRSFSGEEESDTLAGSANAKLYPPPNGRANVQLAARVARDNCAGVFPQRSSRSSSLRYSTRSSESSSSSRSSGSSLRRERRQNLALVFERDHDARRRSSSDVSSVDSEARSLASPSNAGQREMWRESSVNEFLSCFPRDLIADVRTTCHVKSPRRSKAYMRGLIVSLEFEIRGTKWAAYFLQIVHNARKQKRISLRSAVSVKWAICAHAQGEALARQEEQKRSDMTLQHKMTEYRVALQCVAGTSVVKFGRKGKPHATNLCVENGDTLRWTSKLLAKATHIAVDGVAATTTMGKKRVKAKNAIPLASILRVTSGPSTSVLTRALHKGTLHLNDSGCTLSVVTHTRTLDLKAKTAEEREWLQRSLEFLVDLARDHERRVAQQVELTIMKRMENLPVWKYGRKGKPHKTRVFVDRFGEVSWLGRSGDSLQLDEIISVHEGHRTPVFARARAVGLVSSAKGAHCFSLVTSVRSLDIEAVNEQQRDWFVVAFRYLLDKVHEKTAAMQRERAERQLRMLQDLSREDEDDYLNGDGDDIYYDDLPPARHA
ncbi:uncharacterized protein PITG_08776 [Phytophthora infestans T30-4]|uniref:PH domain-containing protein n=2 Tax=Phytophthora infestans TaxID=4787 RepID=D0ND69_PHYIT|nr:uncharacterized protein PITG_08776 [Phytophthora infestans T30-4]EEY56026.1 conserved hypothetical protein [Phytophthora infestans T30-4]KAF4147031.1 hypothetical protein GN958_ATG03776 [Phytophthora infestans]KAI9981677.1 hypothetical protein PInf_009434 [Phytophthora infestans]|eukprot:XP_002902856.1 conserved hypothetical protein [Phytophthora infestans T30-4]